MISPSMRLPFFSGLWDPKGLETDRFSTAIGSIPRLRSGRLFAALLPYSAAAVLEEH